MKVNKLEILFKKQCNCESSSSGPRLIVKAMVGKYREKLIMSEVQMACDKCDTPWVLVQD